MIITSTKKKKKDEDIAPVLSKETKQAIKSTVSQKAKDIVNASPIGKIKNTFSDGYQVGDVTKTILNVGNMLNPISMVKDKASEIGSTIGTSIKNNKGNFVKSTKSKEKIKNIWDDGYQLGDVSKTFFNIEKSVLGTAGDVAANLAKGELQTAEGLVDTGRYLLSDITKYTNPALSARARRNAIQNTTGVILGENDMYNQPKQNGWTKKLDEYSISGNALDNIIQSVGQQAFRVGLQGAIGMTGASEGATAAFNKLEIFAGSYGSSKSQALMNGADDTTATIKGFIGGTSEYISENLFDSIPGFKTGELKGITKVKDLIGKSAEKTFGKTAGKAMIRVFSALGEGTEERISNGLETALTDIVNAINPSYVYGMEEGQGLTESTFGKNALKLFQDTFKSAFSKESNEAFVSAFFSTLITGAIADTMTAADRNKVIKAYAKDNNITNEQATELFDGITELRTQQIADETTSYEDATNIKEQVSKQLTEEIRNDKKFSLAELQEGLINRDKFTKAVGTGVVSSRGLDLVESYKAYNGDTKYKNEIANIQKFMNNRNIDARFDATMFDNNEQNAIWTTENGKDSVVFNPNATQEQVIQSIATHEMTHDIINQKTEAGTSLFNDVLENIKTQKDYAKNRQEIEDLYAKYYDRNSEDFAAKVDEEMVANELGKNLGTQEYINRLVNEKPNLAKRIYNWVVDKLDNIGKSSEYKEQKAYWKSVADKFEVAYNEQKTTTGEDKTAYSVKQSKAMLEKQFKELTGDSLLRAEGKLGLYAFQQMNNIQAEAPYSEEAMKLFNNIQNSKKTSSHLYHSTPADRIQSIVQNGLQVGSKQNQEGVSSTNKLYLSATEDLASSFTPQDSVMLRISPNANLENLDNDLLGGEGSYTITNNIDPKYLQVKENGKWIPLLKSKYANQTRYSLTKDSKNKNLSQEQQEYFKNSKIRDSKGRLLRVYHGTDNGNFNVFDENMVGSNLAPAFGEGFYFDSQKSTSEAYTGRNGVENIKSVYLNIENPYYASDSEAFTLHRQDLIDKGYDGVSVYGHEFVAFYPEQIKNIDNTNPTTNPDIRYSMQQEEAPFTKGTRTTIGELFGRDIAPIREDLSNIREQMNNLSNQLETMQESLGNTSESTNRGYVEPFREQRYENESYTPLTEEEADLYQNALLNDEAYKRSVDEQADFEENNTKLINKLTDDVQSRLALDKKQKSTLESIIKDAVDNDLTTDEIVEKLTRQFKQQEEKYTNDEIKEVKKSIKRTAIKVSDGIKKDIADYGDFQRRNLNKITFSKNGLPVDVAYQALQEQMPSYFPNDIINPTDQLLRISDVANMANEITENYLLPDDVFEDIADYIYESKLDDEYNSQMESEASLDTDIRMNFTEDLAPTTIRSQESIDNFIENRDIAPVRQDTLNKIKSSDFAQQLSKMNVKAQEMLVNRNYVIDQFAKATGNNEIKFWGDQWNNAMAEANFNINEYQTDIFGDEVGKGLNQIFKPIEDAGLAVPFNDYLIQKSNIERHSVGKGTVVPLEVSKQLVAQYEKEYGKIFVNTAKEVHNLINNYSIEQVDSGLLSQQKYQDYRGENGIYGEYVPIIPAETDTSRYYDNEGNVKPFSTFKRSKGGAEDVNKTLSVKDAIARQIMATKEAVAFNELAKQIVSSSEQFEDALDIDTRDNPTNLKEALYITPDGEYVLSAYFDGEKISAKISKELYQELTRENENRIKQLEQDFAPITKPLQKVSNLRREILTSKNPTFLARNTIKDVQDAAINSKYSTDMLGYYLGTQEGHKAAIIELKEAKTKEAKRFLAKMGGDILHGDYSNESKGIFKSVENANQLLELAPRYAEYLATLKNGGSEVEALYNAREVTTNFGRGGYITKALNRNGFTFLNANIQGLDKVIRNLSGENGVKGVTSVVAKGVAFAILPSILNHLLYGLGDDKDEEYEALPDYVKDNYYLIKLTSGKYLRIPKGRINAVFGSLARRSIETLEGEDDAFKGYGSNAWSQIGVGDSSGLQTIFTPLKQAQLFRNDKEHPGEAWYGGDIVPTRLQNKPAAEQTDASIDAISNAIGKVTGLSPYKINYVLDQYSGGIGDVLLPMITEETTSGAENPLEYLTAPIKDAFIVNSTDDNKYAGEFYDMKDKLEIQSNSEKATDEDKLKYKYMSSMSSKMSELYKERREVQADTTLSNKEKYAKVQAIQNEINSLAKEALNSYKDFGVTNGYTNIGDTEYYKNNEGKWTKVSDDEEEFTAGLNATEKSSYYNTKNKIGNITTEYKEKTKDLDKDSPLKAQYSAQRKEDITRTIINSGLDNYTKAMMYSKYYSDKDTMTNVVNAGYNTDTYITALSDIEILRDKYSQKKGYTTEQRKQKTIAYINSLDMNIPQKAMLTRRYYSSFRTYNKDIVNYVSNLDITQDEKVSILKDMGMTVKGNKVSWK